MHDAISINNHTKGEGKMYVPKPSIATCRFTQSQNLFDKIQKENGPSSLRKRIFLSAPHVEFSNSDESKTVDHQTKFTP